MKKILLLFVFASTALAQLRVVEVTPLISTVGVDSVIAKNGSDTLKARLADFDSAAVGQKIVGTYIPFGATITAVQGDTIIVISSTLTVASSPDSLAKVSIGKFQGSQAYASSDALGFPFEVTGLGSSIHQIIVEDDSKQITGVDIVFFDSLFAPTVDTAAFAPSDADARNIVGYITIGGTGANKALTNNNILQIPFTNAVWPVPKSKRYVCQLVATSTPTFTASNNLRIKFIVE